MLKKLANFLGESCHCQSFVPFGSLVCQVQDIGAGNSEEGDFFAGFFHGVWYNWDEKLC